MATGRVKFFNVERHFGFIIPDDQPREDIFVHGTDIQYTDFLLPHQRVTYDLVLNARNGRPKAGNVTLLDD